MGWHPNFTLVRLEKIHKALKRQIKVEKYIERLESAELNCNAVKAVSNLCKFSRLMTDKQLIIFLSSKLLASSKQKVSFIRASFCIKWRECV